MNQSTDKRGISWVDNNENKCETEGRGSQKLLTFLLRGSQTHSKFEDIWLWAKVVDGMMGNIEMVKVEFIHRM